MGLVTDVPALAAILLAVVVAMIAVGLLRSRGLQATGLRWLVGILAWSTLALAFAAPSLQRVVPGLPNDHYHAFIDPLVMILIAVPAAGLFEQARAAWRDTRRPVSAIAGVVVASGLAALVAVAILRMPPALDPNGGWPALRDAGTRVARVVASEPVTVRWLPDFKPPDAMTFPMEHAGVEVVRQPRLVERYTVVVCDRLFESVMQQRCGGPAEDVLLGAGTSGLVDRFDASPRTVVSIYDATLRPGS
jgi:hypothetical protein